MLIERLPFHLKTSFIIMSPSTGLLFLRHFHNRSIVHKKNAAADGLPFTLLDNHIMRRRGIWRRGAGDLKPRPFRRRQRRAPGRAPEATDFIVIRVVPFNG